MTYEVQKKNWNYETVRDFQVVCDLTNRSLPRGDEFITVMVDSESALDELTFSKKVCEDFFNPLMSLSMQQIEEIRKGLTEHLTPPADIQIGVDEYDDNGKKQFTGLNIVLQKDGDNEYVTVQKYDGNYDLIGNAYRLISFKRISNGRESWDVKFTYKLEDMYLEKIFNFESDAWRKFLQYVGNRAIDMNNKPVTRNPFMVNVC